MLQSKMMQISEIELNRDLFSVRAKKVTIKAWTTCCLLRQQEWENTRKSLVYRWYTRLFAFCRGFFLTPSGAENGTRTRDLNLGKVALSSPQNASRLGVTNWSISFYDDFLECVLPRFSHWLNGWLNICVCLLVCKWLLIRELFNRLNKFYNTFFFVIHWHSEFMVFK